MSLNESVFSDNEELESILSALDLTHLINRCNGFDTGIDFEWWNIILHKFLSIMKCNNSLSSLYYSFKQYVSFFLYSKKGVFVGWFLTDAMLFLQ